MEYKPKESIVNTKREFEESFQSESFYNKQTQDNLHLKLILSNLKINDGMKILDLGTGTGYLAFPIAENNNVNVVGLDIVEKALQKNREKAELNGLKNLQFVSYNGLTLPFSDGVFDIVVTRYALHHFPDINYTFQEINRILKTNGLFFISDPSPNDNDTDGFVNAYMQMKKDGHIKFYTKTEWQTIGESTGFKYINNFETYIRFPRKKATSLEFDDIINRFDNEAIKGYAIEIIDDEIWITEKVNNLSLKKKEI